MSASSLIRAGLSSGNIVRSLGQASAELPSVVRACAANRVAQAMLPSPRRNSSSSISSINSVSSVDSILGFNSSRSVSSFSSLFGSSSSLSLSSWIGDNNLSDKAHLVEDDSLCDDSKSSFAHTLSPELLRKIETNTTTGDKYVLLMKESSSRFIFFPKGDLTKKYYFSVLHEDTGESINSEVDLRDMVSCFCLMKESLNESWEKKASEMSLLFKINKKDITYNVFLIHFDAKQVIAFSHSKPSLKGISQFRGTKLELSKIAKENIGDILERRSKKNSENKS